MQSTRDNKITVESTSKIETKIYKTPKNVKAKKINLKEFIADDMSVKRQERKSKRNKKTNDEALKKSEINENREDFLSRANISKLDNNKRRRRRNKGQKNYYPNIRYFAKLILLKRIKDIKENYLFIDNREEYFKILSSVNLSLLFQSYNKNEESKITAAIETMQSLDNNIYEIYSYLKVFCVLLTALNVEYNFEYFFNLKNVFLESNLIFKSNKNIPKYKLPSFTIAKASIKSYNSILGAIESEMFNNNLLIKMKHKKMFKYNLNITKKPLKFMFDNLKNSGFFAALRIERVDNKIVVSDVSVCLLSNIWTELDRKTYKIHLRDELECITENNMYLTSNEKAMIQNAYENYVPDSHNGFRINRVYVTRSTLKVIEYLPEDAPPTSYKFKGEAVYLRNCLVRLRGHTQWRHRGRIIKRGEKPLKYVDEYKDHKGTIGLYAEWQTQPYKIELDNGKLPENKYGNIEVFANNLSEGMVHIDKKGISRICRKLNVPFKVAVVGFERRRNRRFIRKSGVVVCKKDEEIVLNEYNNLLKETAIKQSELREETTIKSWKKVFMKLLIVYFTEKNSLV